MSPRRLFLLIKCKLQNQICQDQSENPSSGHAQAEAGAAAQEKEREERDRDGDSRRYFWQQFSSVCAGNNAFFPLNLAFIEFTNSVYFLN